MLVTGVSVKRTVTAIVTVITLIVFSWQKKVVHSYLRLSIYIYSIWQTPLSKAIVYSKGYKLEVAVSSVDIIVKMFIFVYTTGRRGWKGLKLFAVRVYDCVRMQET